MRIVNCGSREVRSIDIIRALGHEVIDVTGRRVDEIIDLKPDIAVSLNGWYAVSRDTGNILMELYKRGIGVLTSGNDTSNKELPNLITGGFRGTLTREEGELKLIPHYITEGVEPVNVGGDYRFNITGVTDGTEILAYSVKGTLELLVREDEFNDKKVRWIHFHPRWWYRNKRLFKNCLDYLTFKPYPVKWLEENWTSIVSVSPLIVVGSIIGFNEAKKLIKI